MIGHLKGKVVHKQKDSLIVSCGPVGYEVFYIHDVPVGEEVEFFIYTHVREDALQLFAFSSLKEKDFFIQLVRKVSGIGPKVALQILSHTSIDNLCSFIEKKDIKALSKLPKVGKKKAEQIVLNLKGQFEAPSEPFLDNPLEKQLFSTLLNLGFHRSEVEQALGMVKNKESLEQGLREALNILNSYKETSWNKSL